MGCRCGACLFGAGLLVLLFFISLHATPVVSQHSSIQPTFEYRVIDVPPDTRGIRDALESSLAQ